jgi:PTH1 family peptidyl-tRNA hydrolase
MVEGYVLHAFAKTDQTWIEPLVDAIADALPTLLAGDAARFLNDVALKTGPVG